MSAVDKVETIAQALYERWNNVPACAASKTWEDLQTALPGQADWFRTMARVALIAIAKVEAQELHAAINWRDAEPIRLSPDAYAKFVDSIENPKPPTEALKRLMRGGDDA